ncbi:MAG: hypothetical protein EB060_03070 [Proteobacteria bacterium]|nr:hypothetical protein [Pseudomonadota bacterium]
MAKQKFTPSVSIDSTGIHIKDLGPSLKPREASFPLSKPDRQFILDVQDALAAGYLLVKIEYEGAILPFPQSDARAPKFPVAGAMPDGRFSRSGISIARTGDPKSDPRLTDGTGYRPMEPITADEPVLKIFAGNLPHHPKGAFERLKALKGATLMPWDDASRPIVGTETTPTYFGFGTPKEKDVMMAGYTNSVGFRGRDALMIAQILYQVGLAQAADGVPEDKRVKVQGFDMAAQVQSMTEVVRAGIVRT